MDKQNREIWKKTFLTTLIISTVGTLVAIVVAEHSRVNSEVVNEIRFVTHQNTEITYEVDSGNIDCVEADLSTGQSITTAFVSIDDGNLGKEIVATFANPELQRLICDSVGEAFGGKLRVESIHGVAQSPERMYILTSSEN